MADIIIITDIVFCIAEVDHLDTARALAAAHAASCPARGPDSLGFLLGSSGVFALCAVLAKSSGAWHGLKRNHDNIQDLYTGDQTSLAKYLSLYRNCLQDFLTPDPLKCGSDEV